MVRERGKLMPEAEHSITPKWFTDILVATRPTLKFYYEKGLPDSIRDAIFQQLKGLFDAGKTQVEILIAFEEEVGVYKARGIDRLS